MLRDLILRDRGQQEAEAFDQFRLSSLQLLADTASELLNHTPVWFGACAAMSAMWAVLLRERHNIPAVVIAGDLRIEGITVFSCESNIPDPKNLTHSVRGGWDGHCWIEVDDHVGDVSVFRTARTVKGPSVLRSFIERNFGLQRGMMLYGRSALHAMGMEYIPKYALTDSQMNGVIAGMKHELQHGEGTLTRRSRRRRKTRRA